MRVKTSHNPQSLYALKGHPEHVYILSESEGRLVLRDPLTLKPQLEVTDEELKTQYVKVKGPYRQSTK